jgi:leucyl-tRNA synthetase
MAEELWSLIGHKDSVHSQQWPNIVENLLAEDSIEIPVQINGKVRGKIKVSTENTEEDVRQKVLSEKAFSAYLDGNSIKKFIYVPKKIVNVVV